MIQGAIVCWGKWATFSRNYSFNITTTSHSLLNLEWECTTYHHMGWMVSHSLSPIFFDSSKHQKDFELMSIVSLIPITRTKLCMFQWPGNHEGVTSFRVFNKSSEDYNFQLIWVESIISSSNQSGVINME